MNREELAIFGFTRKEYKVIKAISLGVSSPTDIALKTKVTRQGVYKILYSLRKRGIVDRTKKDKVKSWTMVSKEEFLSTVQKATDTLLSQNDGLTAVNHFGAGDIVMYSGRVGLETVFKTLSLDYSKQEAFSLQTKKGDLAWLHVFSPEEVQRYVSLISKNKLIHRSIYEKGMLKHAFDTYGVDWARRFIGRTSSVNEIDGKYTNFSSEILISTTTLYMLSVEDQVALVIRNKNFVKMIRSMLEFIHDSSHKINTNEQLKQLIARKEKEMKEV